MNALHKMVSPSRTHPESFGSIKHYGTLICLVKDKKKEWRKCARLIASLRFVLTPRSFVDTSEQKKSARQMLVQSFKDTILSKEIKDAIYAGVSSEFRL